MGYKKINNLYKDQTILSFKECYAMEKVHGCLNENTLVLTENDGTKTIKEICDSEYKGKILSYDVEKSEKVFKKVTNHMITDETEDWYEIELDNGTTITATSNHKFWLPTLKCWRELKDLSINDILLIKS